MVLLGMNLLVCFFCWFWKVACHVRRVVAAVSTACVHIRIVRKVHSLLRRVCLSVHGKVVVV